MVDHRREVSAFAVSAEYFPVNGHIYLVHVHLIKKFLNGLVTLRHIRCRMRAQVNPVILSESSNTAETLLAVLVIHYYHVIFVQAHDHFCCRMRPCAIVKSIRIMCILLRQRIIDTHTLISTEFIFCSPRSHRKLPYFAKSIFAWSICLVR